MKNFYDVVVIGGGHAGTEAAFAAANLGSKVLLLVTNLQNIALMPCNPSIGGPGKGHLVKEIHALGGQMGDNVDNTYLQMRELNESRGPAVRALRAQCDKRHYHLYVKEKLENHPLIDIIQDEACELIKTDKNWFVKIITGLQFETCSVVLATGTYLSGTIILGNSRVSGGPAGQSPSNHLSQSLKNLGLDLIRLQTATPSRISGKSIEFDGLKPLGGTSGIKTFTGKPPKTNQRECYLTYTNEKTIKIIKDNIELSPLKIGNITQRGPKHCPSIDRKVMRFPDQVVHQIFIEPESDLYGEYYLQGLTTALPAAIQEQIIHSVKGLEKAEIVRYGYAIEYDAINTLQLQPNLEIKQQSGLFACGQINGTSGYEEAAAQGLIAGINAHMKAQNLPPFVLPSTSSYLANLIEELVSNEHTQPLRVSTSLSEFRLHFRCDNAEQRLAPIGAKIGLIPEATWNLYQQQQQTIDKEIKQLKEHIIRPNKTTITTLEQMGSCHINNPLSLAELLGRNEISYLDLKALDYPCIDDPNIITRIEIYLKYSIFLEKLYLKMEKADQLDQMQLPPQFDYQTILGLSTQGVKDLNIVQPWSVGQAARIRDLTAADLTILINFCKQNKTS